MLKSKFHDCNAAAKPNIAKLDVLPFLNIKGDAWLLTVTVGKAVSVGALNIPVKEKDIRGILFTSQLILNVPLAPVTLCLIPS